jgi:hypothetical protein
MCSESYTAGVETIIQLIPRFVHGVTSDGSYGSCDLLSQLQQRFHKWILDWVVPCEMHAAQLLQIRSSLTAEHTNFYVLV